MRQGQQGTNPWSMKCCRPFMYNVTDCRCKGCKNCSAELDISTVFETSIPEHVSNVSCKCGQNKSKELPEFVACKDGIRKSKCPCWRVKQKCGFQCKCVKCGNPNERIMRRRDWKNNNIQQKRKRERRSAEFSASQDILPVTMDHVRDVLIIQRIVASRRNHSAAIARKYNWFVLKQLVNSKICKESNYTVSRKRESQVSVKLNTLIEKPKIWMLLSKWQLILY